MLKRFLILLSFIVFLLVSPPLAKADCDPSQYNVNIPQQFRGASCPSNYCEISHTGSPPNTLYTCAPSITDNKITFGPVHIITPDSYNGDSKITITVTTKNPDASYNNIDVPKLAPQVYYLDSVNNLINGSTNPNSPTTIDIPISSIKLIVNGQQNSCVSFGVDTSAGSNPLPQSHIAGDSTGEFNFAGSRVPGCNFGQSSSQVGDATIALNPPII
ncbi:hypothetical protein HY025_06165 [Candidatus Daviesbacteria bacterium]|nr:hypothetical protein [Candidatus Daviesbacteria bacterium]